MADNLVLNLGSGGSTLKTDELSDLTHVEYVKLLDPTADSSTIVGVPANGVHGNAMRVTIASDSTGQVKLAAGSAAIGTANIGTWATAAATSPVTLEDTASASGDALMKIAARRIAIPADTSGTDGDYEPLSVDNGKLWTQTGGSVAHDAAVGTNDHPLLGGSYAVETDGTAQTAVAEADVARNVSDRIGRVLVSDVHPYRFSASVDYAAAAQTNATIQAAVASVSIYITDLTISNGPSAVNNVKLLDGSGGTSLYEVYMAVNSNVTISLRNPLRLTANTLLAVTSTGTSELAVNVSGYYAV